MRRCHVLTQNARNNSGLLNGRHAAMDTYLFASSVKLTLIHYSISMNHSVQAHLTTEWDEARCWLGPLVPSRQIICRLICRLLQRLDALVPNLFRILKKLGMGWQVGDCGRFRTTSDAKDCLTEGQALHHIGGVDQYSKAWDVHTLADHPDRDQPAV